MSQEKQHNRIAPFQKQLDVFLRLRLRGRYLKMTQQVLKTAWLGTTSFLRE